jgi:GPH family glycoside/pentoside/hexuronide:cation symporter
MKLKLRTKISYGIGGLADNALFMLIETFLLFYLTTVAGIKPATAGTILAVGCLWEAFCGPISGFLSDHMESRYGKRKPFLMAAAVPTAIVTTLLFTNIELEGTAKVLYYGLLTLLFWGCFAIFFVPYVTWGSDLTEDYNERTVLRSYAYVFNQIGKFLGTVMPTVLVAALTGIGLSVATSWSAVGLIVGLFSGAALLICALTIKETDEALNAILAVMEEALLAEDKVQITGFGTFEIKERQAKVGRDPRTKEPITIPATQVPVFRPCKDLKDRVAK